MKIAAIMPCRGRVEQTVENVRRLLATAGSGVWWHLWCVVDNDPAVYEALGQFGTGEITRLAQNIHTSGYWRCLAHATEETDAPLLVNLANDLLPGLHWLKRAADAYRATFGDGDGMIGFNDGIHEVGHSPHFLISRGLLMRYGGWPIWYGHNFGDSEVCARAIEEGLYAKAPWAVLYHDHWINGGKRDAVYAEGDANGEVDQRLFEQRRRQGWPRVSA